MITIERIKNVCVWTLIFLTTQQAFCGAYTVVYAFSNITSQENAILKILLGLIAFAILSVGKLQSIRKWIVTHYVFFAIAGVIVDGGTELLLLKSPMTKLICDVVALSSFFKLYKIQIEERVNAIFNTEDRKNERTKFNLDLDRAACIGGVIGGLVAMIFPDIPIQIIIWVSAIWTAATYIICIYRFVLMDRYIRANGLVYPYEQADKQK